MDTQEEKENDKMYLKNLNQNIKNLKEVILNLDCINNEEDMLKQWSNEMILLILTYEKFSSLSTLDMKNFLVYKTRGNVHKFLASIHESEWRSILSMVRSNQEAIEIIMNSIYQEFIE